MATILDQDGTLYSKKSPLNREMSRAGMAWAAMRLGISLEAVGPLIQQLQATFPNPLDGYESLGISPQEYHACVFDRVAVSEYDCNADERLVEWLSAIGDPRYVVTLSSPSFSDQVLSKLGVRHLIADRFSLPVETNGARDKIEVYERIRALLALPRCAVTIIGDNFEVDLRAALRSGYRCILISDEQHPDVPTFPSLPDIPLGLVQRN